MKSKSAISYLLLLSITLALVLITCSEQYETIAPRINPKDEKGTNYAEYTTTVALTTTTNVSTSTSSTTTTSTSTTTVAPTTSISSTSSSTSTSTTTSTLTSTTASTSTTTTTVAPIYNLRDTGPAGGIIFYINPNYQTDGWRYLECAPASTEWTSKVWGGFGTSVNGADGTAIGTGELNTLNIVTQFGDTEVTDYAAKSCYYLEFGGYDDWFLPSRDELNLMYVNLHSQSVGGFGNYDYWSSSETSNIYAWIKDFYSGSQGSYAKDSDCRVRAIRAFSDNESPTTTSTTTSTSTTTTTTSSSSTSTITTTSTIPNFIVSFDSQGGSSVESQTIYCQGYVTEPPNPIKVGCTFIGWYKDEDFTASWIFDVNTVTENITLYAKFIDALWAKSVTAGAYGSTFCSVAVDSSGNVYAAGYQCSTVSYTYGEGVSVAGTSSSGSNVVLVKYDSSGTALWAKSVTAGNYSEFFSVAVDSSGNIYAAGRQGTGSHTYGDGISVAGTGALNVVLVKYDSSGTALWAKSVTAGTNESHFNSVAIDSSGNVYAAGEQWRTGSLTYGEGVSVAGTYSSGPNVVLVKYDSSGNALWAKSVTAGIGGSRFYSVAVDSSGNVYAAGYQWGTGSYTYGEGVSVAGASSSCDNVILAKYDSSGTALWAKSVTAGTGHSSFNSVAVDSSGNVYAAGYQYGGSFTYGDGVSVAGTGALNVVLVKYDSSGNALWAKSVTAGTNESYFNSVAVDSSGNVYAAGYQNRAGSYTYGAGVSVAGTYPDGYNVVLAKYDSSGTALWAKSVTAGTGHSSFNSVAVDSSGNVYAAGEQRGAGSYTYCTGVSVAGTYESNNVVIVKYDNP
ncbi:MAG: InlB B-repeat-containing protein [Spirochaetes bacterium]|nr:InlB B-repeat-containing protein [Spirochaetota bacterium]